MEIMKYKKLQEEIMKVSTLKELNELSALILHKKTMLGKESLSVGANVFVVQKTKRTPGVITKMNIKKAIVEMNGMSYNVPFSMLELAKGNN